MKKTLQEGTRVRIHTPEDHEIHNRIGIITKRYHHHFQFSEAYDSYDVRLGEGVVLTNLRMREISKF